MTVARIGIGSNVGDSAHTIARAYEALARLGTLRARSSLYLSRAWGVTDQPDFLNAAALLETPLDARSLLRELQSIERALGRTPTFRWGPRAIDLDILAYGDERRDEPDLVIPHPRLLQRAFALAPLSEIDPAYGDAYAALPVEARAEVRRLDSKTSSCELDANA